MSEEEGGGGQKQKQARALEGRQGACGRRVAPRLDVIVVDASKKSWCAHAATAHRESQEARAPMPAAAV